MTRLPDLLRHLVPARPYAGRRTAQGHPAMALFRWAGVGARWALLFSLPVAMIVLWIILI